MRTLVACATVLLFAGLTVGGVVLAEQNARLRDEVATLIVQRNARHVALCRYLHGQAALPRVPVPLPSLAAAAYRGEDCGN